MATNTKEAWPGPGIDLTGQNEFSTRLVLELARRPGNLFVSPSSAWSLVALLRPGARGETRELLDRVLGIGEDIVLDSRAGEIEELTEEVTPRRFKILELKGPPESFPKSFFVKKREFDLLIANALWIQKGYKLERKYVDEVTERFKARIEELDLKGNPRDSCDRINHWAEEKTRGRIPYVLSPGEVGPLTRLILANATYFKDDWRHEFDPEETRKEPFYLHDTSKVDVQMMHQQSTLLYFEDRNVQAVRLPYRHSSLSMTVVLPKQIREFESALTPESLEKLFRSQGLELVLLALPRWKFRDNLLLVPSLGALGLESLFEGPVDLTGISSEPGVHVDQIKQATFVEIDERGTEAAAVTTGMVIGAVFPQPEPTPKIMIVDHPYWFFIRDDRSGTMLFAGRVEDPS